METKPTEKRPDRKLTWKELDFQGQMVYIRKAEYLQEKGYFVGMYYYKVAEILYYRDEKVE